MAGVFRWGWLSSRQGIPILDHKFTHANWHQLVRLRLEYVQSLSHHFLNFLRRHATTFKHLSLSMFSLIGATWEDTLWEMKSILHLDEASFAGFFVSSGHGVIGAADENFFTPMDFYSPDWKTTRGRMVGRMLYGGVDLTRRELERILKGEASIFR